MDYVELTTTNGIKFLVDRADCSTLVQYRWFATKEHNSNNFVIRAFKSKRITLHRFITNAPKGMVVDHINHNTLDNRRSNLRVCTQKQNSWNSHKKSNHTNPYKGVHRSSMGRWKAVIREAGKYKHIGVYDTPEEAAIAYDRKAIELFGEYACKNF